MFSYSRLVFYFLYIFIFQTFLNNKTVSNNIQPEPMLVCHDDFSITRNSINHTVVSVPRHNYVLLSWRNSHIGLSQYRVQGPAAPAVAGGRRPSKGPQRPQGSIVGKISIKIKTLQFPKNHWHALTTFR